SEVFEAHLPLSAAVDATEYIGSVVLLTGICTVHGDSDHNPVSFSILLRSSKDIIVVKHASWWTASHAAWVVGLLVIMVLVMAGWLAVVRRQASLRLLTVTDPLTGLYNRRGFFLLAERQWQLVLRKKTSILLFYIDVDHFKEINDLLGHKEGDRALRTVASALRECFRKTDIVARMGGDEFAITAIEDPGSSRAVMEQRLADIVRKNNEKDGAFQLSLSVGVLTCDHSLGALSIEDLLAQADTLMYEQKRDRRNRPKEVLVGALG
ncbi:MAG: GGDEF domain-containing protein, partial [Bryobacteraceae bacterium]|nr:GGDEF domain-containing protein [Bryobacteraceae bacterium]